MKNKYTSADIAAIVIYIIQVIIKLVFYVSIAMYFYNAELGMFKIFMVAGAVLCTLITIDDVVHTVLNNFYFDNYTTLTIDEPTNIFDYQIHVKDSDVKGYAKGYFIKYDKETKSRKLLVYMYNDKLYPLDDVEFVVGEEQYGNSITD